jgi:TRAP-type C4-dicarboxylate transport system permease small subunit
VQAALDSGLAASRRPGMTVDGGIMRVFLDRLYLYSGYLAGAFMVAIFVLMMLLSAGRPIGLNIPAADDFVSWCMAAMSFLGLAHTFRHGEMIRVGLLIDRLPTRSRHWTEIVCLVIGIGFVGFFTFYAGQLVHDSWRFHEMSQGVIVVPLWIPQIGYFAGLFILLIAFVDELIHVARGNPPRYEKPKPTTAEEVVEQAIQSGV